MKGKNSGITRSMHLIERSVNRLPDPFFLFLGLAAIVVISSYLAAVFNISVINPANGQRISAVNLLSKSGLLRMLSDMVKNFVEFPPFGLVLATVIGIGVAERTGFFEAILKHTLAKAPRGTITFLLICAGVNANIMGDAGLVIMPSLGALLFASIGRHPLAGLCAGFAGVCGGFSANFFLSTLDPLLSGFTDSAAKLIDKNYTVFPTANYYFMFVSTILISIAGTLTNYYIIEPRLGEWKPDKNNKELPCGFGSSSERERRALILGFVSFFMIIGLILIAAVPTGGFLRGSDGSLLPFFKSLIPLILLIFLISGAVYGIAAGNIRNSKDLSKILIETMSSMGPYILLAFAAGQFVAYFNWSNLGIIIAVQGSEFLKAIGLKGIPLIIAFYIFSSVMNIFIYSASAKWAVFSVVFVPMFMLMGFSPETTQMAYRAGDSVTNMITPLLPYFPIVIVFAKKYLPDITLGRLISILIPYSIVFFVVWGIFLTIWIILGISPGPDAPIYYLPKF
ncbi:MAG: aminobenzoyl-glutamate transport protein [Bacteroidota bacterium]|nr:aminobenzoyl-glutamate transport protein [Bacteroidota bacterium]